MNNAAWLALGDTVCRARTAAYLLWFNRRRCEGKLAARQYNLDMQFAYLSGALDRCLQHSQPPAVRVLADGTELARVFFRELPFHGMEDYPAAVAHQLAAMGDHLRTALPLQGAVQVHLRALLRQVDRWQL
jgi:hypothetical protein